MQVKGVYLYLDRDKSGRELTERFKKALSGIAVKDKSDLYAFYKDFNAWLMASLKSPSSFSFHSQHVLGISFEIENWQRDRRSFLYRTHVKIG